LVSLPPANGLGLLVPLSPRERIADGAELDLLHAAGNTRTKSHDWEVRLKDTFGTATRHCRELKGSLSAVPPLLNAPSVRLSHHHQPNETNSLMITWMTHPRTSTWLYS